MRVIGYGRASPGSPNPQPQVDAIKEWAVRNGHEVVDCFVDDQVSGKDFERIGWARAKEAVTSSDAIVCAKLDRFGRSVKHILKEVEWLSARGKGLITIDGVINTTPNQEDGMAKALRDLTLNLFGAIAEFERALINERTKAGRARAKAKGVKFGRKPLDLPRSAVLSMRRQKKSLREIANEFDTSPRTIWRALRRWGGDPLKTITVVNDE